MKPRKVAKPNLWLRMQKQIHLSINFNQLFFFSSIKVIIIIIIVIMTVVIFDINMNIRVILWMLLLAQE